MTSSPTSVAGDEHLSSNVVRVPAAPYLAMVGPTDSLMWMV